MGLNAAGCILVALAALLPAKSANIAGAALDGHTIYTWGRDLREWNPSRLVAKANSEFGEGGCIDGDAIILQDGAPLGNLVRVRLADGRRTVLDHDVEMHDCLATTLFGKHGVLVVHRYAQVRFYYDGGVQEVYSFYTASKQGGLLRAEGRSDILCGNYWIRGPERFELPWRLFAINVRHETPESANFRLAWLGADLIAAQGHMAAGIVYRYSPPADRTQQWIETRVAELHFPHAVATTPAGVVIGENAGPGSRVFLLRTDGTMERIATTDGVHTALSDGDRVALVGAERVRWISVGKP